MKYDKQPIELSRQLDLLKQRGLLVDDDSEALELLHSISYFRLARYWQVLEDVNSATHKFLPNCHLDDVIRLYLLDKKLRALTFISIQDIEIALRTRMIQQLSLIHI